VRWDIEEGRVMGYLVGDGEGQDYGLQLVV